MTTETTRAAEAGGSQVERGVRPEVPTRTEVEALMKRCQIGVGGRHALDNAHSIMADCYGTLGALAIGLERNSDVIQRLWRERDDLRAAATKARAALSELLMTRDPLVYSDALRALDEVLGPNARLSGAGTASA